MLWFRSAFIATALTLACCTAYAQTPVPATSDASSSYGWLEGTITNSDGQPISQRNLAGGQEIKGIRQGGGQFDVQSDLNLGGLFSVKNLRPGIYDITLEKGWVGGQLGPQTPYCPERIFGVLIKPGERTVLKIVMDQGDTYEEVGKPAVVSAPATNVTDELARMQKQIDDLKQQVATLLKATANAAPTTPTGKP